VQSVTRRGYYHPDQLTYVPPEFSRERLPPPAEPGTEEWFYGPVARENGFLPRTVRAMRPLEHQLSRFPMGDSTVLRADVAFELDDIGPANGPVELGLFVLDSSLAIIGEVRDTVTALGRFAWGGLETRLPENAWAYSVEAREMGTWQAARSRHQLPVPPEGTLTIADLVLLPSRAEDPTRGGSPTRGDAAFRPFGSLLLDRDQEVAMYLEVRGLVPGDDGLLHYRMDLRVVKGDDEESGSGTLTWTDEHAPVEMLPVTTDLGSFPTEGAVGRAVSGIADLLTGGESGVLQTLVLTVTDLVSGESSTVRRLVKVRS
jgi:hypothetical protein